MDLKNIKRLFGSIAVVILIIGIFLYSNGIISELAFVIALFSIAAASAGLFYYIDNKTALDSTEIKEQQLHREYKKKTVQRTREGTIFELVTALILALSLFLGFVTHTFERRGTIHDGYVFFFICAIAGLILAYHPLFVSNPNAYRITNDEQFKLRIRKNRVLAIIFALITLTLSITPEDNHLLTLIFIILTITLFGTLLIFTFLHNKNK